MFTDEQIKGNLNSVDRQLLYDIRDLLKEQNMLLRNLNSENIRDTPVKDKPRGGRPSNKMKEASA